MDGPAPEPETSGAPAAGQGLPAQKADPKTVPGSPLRSAASCTKIVRLSSGDSLPVVVWAPGAGKESWGLLLQTIPKAATDQDWLDILDAFRGDRPLYLLMTKFGEPSRSGAKATKAEVEAGDFGPIGPCFNPNEDNVNFQPGDDDQADRDNRWLNVWTHMADAAAKSGGKAVQVYDEAQGLSQMQRAEATIAGYLGLRVERRRLGLAGGAVTGHRSLQMSLRTGQQGSSGPNVSSSTLQVDAQFALKMPSPAVTPPRGPSPGRLVATLSQTSSAELLVRRWGRSRGDVQSRNFEVYPVVERDGGPTILDNHELHRAILVSHSRRDPAALNLTYAVTSMGRMYGYAHHNCI